VTLSADEATRLVAALQGELAGVSAKVSSLEETIARRQGASSLICSRRFAGEPNSPVAAICAPSAETKPL
jgi:hypothetical protein